MKYLFLLLALFSADAFSAGLVSEVCKYGSRNHQITDYFSSQEFCEIIYPDYAAPSWPGVVAYGCEDAAGFIVLDADCGQPDPSPCPAESICYDPDPDPNCLPGQICTPSCRDGASLVSEGPNLFRCQGGPGDGGGDPGDGGGDPGDGGGDPGDGGGDPGDGGGDPGDGGGDPGDGGGDPGDGGGDPGDGGGDPGDGGGDPGDGGGDPGDGGGDPGDGDSNQTRTDDESSCGIGMRPDSSGFCRPIPDNCGYINGVYACAQPEPPSGCGTIAGPDGVPISDCFEEKPGCGYFNDTYGCFDSDDSTSCQGGILINGVCNKDGQQQPSCPAGYKYVEGSGCVNSVSSCPIGTSKSPLTGACETDDCPAGKYYMGGVCLDIPPTPQPGTNPGTDPGTNPGTDPGNDSDKIDLSSVNSRLDRMISAQKTADANNLSALNRVGSKIENLHATNKNILSESKRANQKLTGIKDSVDGVIGQTKKVNENLEKVDESLKNLVEQTDQSSSDFIDNEKADFDLEGYDSAVQDSLNQDSPMQEPSAVAESVKQVLPSYHACQQFIIQFSSFPMAVPCDRFEEWKQILAWVLYMWTVFYLFDLVLRPVDSKV